MSFADDTRNRAARAPRPPDHQRDRLLGGVRDEQYRIEPGTALGVANRRIAWIGPTPTRGRSRRGA